MKKFKFQLAALLKVTKMKKEEAEIAFAEATEQFLQQQQVLRALEAEETQSLQCYHQTAQTKITIAELMLYSSYFDQIKARKKEQEKRIAEAAALRQKALTVLQQAMSKLKTIEQLRDKRFAQFQENLLAEEQKALDEIGLQIYTRMVR